VRERRERVCDRIAVDGARVGILREHPRHEIGESARHLRPQLGDPRRILEDDLREDREQVLAGERRAPGQALEQHAPEREHVRARIDRMAAARLLRCHVAGGAEHGAAARVAWPRGGLHDPEVDDLHDVADEQQVRRLDVAVHEPVTVRLAERACDLDPERDGLRDVERAAREPLRERLAVDPIHREPQPAVVRAAVADVADDVRMCDLREHAALALEARGGVRVDVRQHLQRDVASVAAIPRAVHGPHPAFGGAHRDHEPLVDDVPPASRTLIISRLAMRSPDAPGAIASYARSSIFGDNEHAVDLRS
jgi:hypothetical protein